MSASLESGADLAARLRLEEVPRGLPSVAAPGASAHRLGLEEAPPGASAHRPRPSAGPAGRSMMEIIETLLLKNRTIVSSDVDECMRLLATELPLMLHRYPTGQEVASWIVPPRWDVKRAVLSDGKRTIASSEDHPLFLAPYSISFSGWVSREELLGHVRTRKDLPDVFTYEFRLAYDFKKRLNDWVISLPYRLVQELQEPRYRVEIEVETGPGHLLVGESFHRGQSPATFVFLAHLCHPGQANDGLAGVAAGVEVMRRLRREFPNPRLSYQLLILPETIGSAVYLGVNESKISTYLGGLFLEMAGIRQPLRYGRTRRGNTYVDRVMREALSQQTENFSECAFLDAWGNDERIFDSPGIGVPTGSLERYPYRWYHTSGDTLAETDPQRLDEIVEVLMNAVRILETDFIPRPVSKIPPYLTRYDLYADWEKERDLYDLQERIRDLFWEGMSVLDIASTVKLPYAKVWSYVSAFVRHGLTEESPITADYGRKTL